MINKSPIEVIIKIGKLRDVNHLFFTWDANSGCYMHSATFSAQGRNELAKGVPYLPSGLYETGKFHPSPRDGFMRVLKGDKAPPWRHATASLRADSIECIK